MGDVTETTVVFYTPLIALLVSRISDQSWFYTGEASHSKTHLIGYILYMSLQEEKMELDAIIL